MSKMRMRSIPAVSVKAGDIIEDGGELVKIVFANRSGLGAVEFSCITTDGLPCLVRRSKQESILVVTDPRVISPQA